MPIREVNGQWVYVDDTGAVKNIPTAASYTVQDPFTARFGAVDGRGALAEAPAQTWPSTPGAGDMARENARGMKEAGPAAGIAGLGTAAQIGLTMIDTAADRENKKRLAELKQDKGLSQAERADIDERNMRGVKAFAAENQTRSDDALAASGQHSAAALQRVRASNADATNRAAIAAADIGIREDRAQVQRDTQEEQERISYEGSRARQRIEMVGQALAGLAPQIATVAAANPTTRPPTDAELDSMRASGQYPWLPPTNDGARELWSQQYRAGQLTRQGGR